MTRTGKNCSLKVTDPTGTRSGQRLIDSFVEKLALDLPKFMQSSDRDKASIIIRALGIEDRLNDIERREKAAYDSRRDASVRLDLASKAAQAMPEYPNVPEQPVSVRELLDELAENDSRNAVIAQARQAIAAASECIASNETSRALLLEQIDALRQRIAALDEDDVRQRQVIDSNSVTAGQEQSELAKTLGVLGLSAYGINRLSHGGDTKVINGNSTSGTGAAQ